MPRDKTCDGESGGKGSYWTLDPVAASEMFERGNYRRRRIRRNRNGSSQVSKMQTKIIETRVRCEDSNFLMRKLLRISISEEFSR